MTTTDLIQHTEQIRNLNDRFRKGDHSLGRVVITRGAQALLESPFEAVEMLEMVKTFDSFNEANDPHGEHDFFSFDYKGKKLFAKIDYYDPTFSEGSENPADPSKTGRLLTIMLAEDY